MSDKTTAPGHTDLMVSPESIDAFLEANPPPADVAQTEVDRVCHEDQLRIWANDVTGMLSIYDFVRPDLSYDEGVQLEQALMQEIKDIVDAAFHHPERTKA